MTDSDIRCPACGQVVDASAAGTKAEDDAQAPLTCPTCGAGFDAEGNLVHEPAIGP